MSDENAVIDHWCWTIEDFESRPEKTGEAMHSSSFVAKQPNRKDSKWKLELYPNGVKENAGFLDLFLVNDNDFPMKAKFQFSIINSEYKKMAVKKIAKGSFDPFEAWGIKRWTSRKSVLKKNKQFLPGGKLTILCEVTVFGTEKTSSGSDSLDDGYDKTATKGMTHVIEQLGKLFNDRELSDVEVECGGEVFNCHQLILSTRSDVFRAMFQSDMKENRTKTVSIKDVNPEVLKEMLQFIYNGATSQNVLKLKTAELLAAAEKYQIDCLKEICEDQLCSMLKVRNSIASLLLGDMHQAFKLRRMALQMVAKNLTSIVPTEEYQDLVKNHQALVAEIPAAMVDVMTSK